MANSVPFKAESNYTADSVARRFGITVDQLQALNPGRNVRAGVLRGVSINVPAVYGQAPAVQSTSTPSGTSVGTPTTDTSAIATQNAADALTSLFNQYGLGSLSGEIVKLAQQGLGNDSITLQLQQSDVYKQRFKANDTRVKNGMNALSPAEYIATESAYRQIMSNAGLPVGFYDSQEDFTNFIAKDISPTELQNRVSAATEAIQQAPASTLNYAKQWYGVGDLVAYALDPDKASSLVEARLKAAEAGALAQQNGTTVSQGLAEQIGYQNPTFAQLQQGFGQVGQEVDTATKLGQIYGLDTNADDLVKLTFLNDAGADKKLKTLASQERAQFGGSSGVGKGSFSNDGGQF